MASAPPLRLALTVLILEPDDARFSMLAGKLAGLDALAVTTVRAQALDGALAALRAKRIDVCFAPSETGPDLAAGLTLRLARAAAFVPVVAVVDDAAAGLEALRDEGASDYLLRDRLDQGELTRALLVARARREAVEAFRHEQEVFGATLRETDLAVVELDAEGLIVRASSAVGPVVGVDPRSLVGRLWEALFADEMGEAVGALLRSAEAPRRALRFQQPDDEGNPVEWVVSAMPSGGAVAVGHPASGHPLITRMEETDALTILQHVTHTLPLVVFTTDREGRIRHLAGAAVEDFGITTEDLEGEPAVELLSPASDRADYLRRALDGEPSEAVIDVQGRLFRTRFVPLLDREGLPDGMVLVGHDVTEQEAADRARQRIAHALDAAADAIGLADVEGQALYVNKAMESLFGYSLEAINAAGGTTALYADSVLAGTVFDTVRGGERWEGEVTFMAHAGTPVEVILSAHAVYDDAGDLIGLLAIHRPLG